MQDEGLLARLKLVVSALACGGDQERARRHVIDWGGDAVEDLLHFIDTKCPKAQIPQRLGYDLEQDAFFLPSPPPSAARPQDPVEHLMDKATNEYADMASETLGVAMSYFTDPNKDNVVRKMAKALSMTENVDLNPTQLDEFELRFSTLVAEKRGAKSTKEEKPGKKRQWEDEDRKKMVMKSFRINVAEQYCREFDRIYKGH